MKRLSCGDGDVFVVAIGDDQLSVEATPGGDPVRRKGKVEINARQDASNWLWKLVEDVRDGVHFTVAHSVWVLPKGIPVRRDGGPVQRDLGLLNPVLSSSTAGLPG